MKMSLGYKPFASGAPNIANVFKIHTYTGNGAVRSITGGIDLSAGGMAWIKDRGAAEGSALFDTIRGATKYIASDGIAGEATDAATLTAFNSDGFSLGADGTSNRVNKNLDTYVAWAFAEASRFFDIVTYTGNGANRTIAHSLGIAPGAIFVKRLDTTGDGRVWHRGLTSSSYVLKLNSDAGQVVDATVWNGTAPTDAVFSLGTNTDVNANGATYVAYIFAHDTASDGIIQCGTFTTDGGGDATVTGLGFQPQFLHLKNINASTNWRMFDTARGWAAGGDAHINSSSAAAESSTANFGAPTADGFTYALGDVTGDYIFIAIAAP